MKNNSFNNLIKAIVCFALAIIPLFILLNVEEFDFASVIIFGGMIVYCVFLGVGWLYQYDQENQTNQHKQQIFIKCKVCNKEIEYNENGTCAECHNKIINRLKNKSNVEEKNISVQEKVYEIIFKSFNKDDIKEIKSLTYTLIEEEQIKEKTTLFLKIIEMQNLLYKEVKESNKLDLPANTLTNLIYLKLYLDAILLIDNDMIDFMNVSVLCRMAGKIEEKLNNYLKLMVEINMLLEDNIIYMFNNITHIDKEYYMIISNKISNLLLEYNDDGTDWNKIFEIPSI